MVITLIAAASENNAIGKDNRLLWHLPNDMKFFKNTTWGMPVIMGRKTFGALSKALPGRFNIVLTSRADWSVKGVITAKNFNEALEKAAGTNCREVFVIGGGEIYRETIAKADRIYLTRVHADLEGDTYFPVIDVIEWRLTDELDFSADEKHAYGYSFQTWDRIRA